MPQDSSISAFKRGIVSTTVAILVLALPGLGAAQADDTQWIIEGAAADDVTGEPIDSFGIDVIVAGSGSPLPEGDHVALTFSDDPGRFYVASPIPGEYLLCFFAPGYQTECFDDHPIAPGGAYTGDVLAMAMGDVLNLQVELSPTGSSDLPVTGPAIPGWSLLVAMSLILLGVWLVTNPSRRDT